MRAWLALAADPLVLASRRRILWVYLIASTLIAAVTAMGLGVSIDLARPTPLPQGGTVEVAFDAPLIPGTARLELGAVRPGDAALSVVSEDPTGALVGPSGLTGHIDRARGVITLTLPASPAPVASTAVVVAGVPLGALRGDARARALDEGRETRLDAFGLSIQRDDVFRPRVTVPVVLGNALFTVLVWTLGSLFGVILGLFAMIDAVPSAFDPGSAELLLSRPVGRGQVVTARFAGALLFGALQAAWLLGLALLVVGVRLGVWLPALLITLGPLLLKFATLLALGSLAAVVTRTTVLGLAAVAAVWVCSYALEQTAPRMAQLAPDGLAAHAALVAERVVPLVTRLDEVGGALVEIDLDPTTIPGPSGALAAGQCLAWTVLCLGLTTAVVSRRDH